MVEANDIISYVAAFVALWWAIDWINMRQEGERLPLRRAPLRILGEVLPKLWRNRTFLLILLSLWLIGATVASVQGYFFRMSSQAPGLQSAQMVRPAFTISDSVPEMLLHELPEALPRLVEVPLGTWAAALFAVLLIAAMVRIVIDPPEAIGEETARKLRWPVGLLAAYLVVWGAITAAGQPFLDKISQGGEHAWAEVPFAVLTLVIVPGLLMAPAYALLWRLVLEITRDGVWSFVSSMRALAECWLPIALLLIIANAFRPMGVLAGHGYESFWGYAYLAVLVLLALAPWAVLDDPEGRAQPFVRSWRLFRQRPVDVIAFALRFTLLFAVLGGLVALVEPSAASRLTTWYAPLLGVARNLLLLLQAMVLAGLYVHLSAVPTEDDACASCPSARLAERLEEQVDRDE